jgi:hypothetical protein
MARDCGSGGTRQHAAAWRDPVRLGLEAVVAQQRVEPDEPAAGAMQTVHLEGQVSDASRSSPSVTRSTTAPWPSTRRDQRRLNSRRHAAIRVPPAQSATWHPNSAQRLVGVARPQLARDVGESCAEHEARHPPACLGQGVEEMQEHPAVLGHRARNVADRDDRRMTFVALEALEVDQAAAAAQAGPERAAHVDEPAPCWRLRRRVGTLFTGRSAVRSAPAPRQSLHRLGGAPSLDVVLIFQQHAERVGDECGRAHRVELGERGGPVERLGDAGRLEQLLPRSACTKATISFVSRAGDPAPWPARSRVRARRRDSRPSDRGSGA